MAAGSNGLASLVAGQQLPSGSRAPALKLLQITTLVIHGADDPLVPVRGGRDTAALIPGAKLHILDRMAHDLPEHHWPRLVALIAVSRAG